MELTGRSSDDAIVALHDCDEDPNRAVDMLLEGEDQQVSSKIKYFEKDTIFPVTLFCPIW